MIKHFYIFMFLVLLNDLAFADLFNKNLFFNNSKVERVIFVDKAKRSLIVYKIQDDIPIEVNRFDNILLGEIEGNKEFEGDKKTPEGVYHVTRFISDDQLAPIYGAGSFPLNYPNFMDKKEGKTGYGIWIHGVDDTKQKDFTQGCVAVQNSEFKELINLNILNNTVVISTEADYGSIESYKSEKDLWMNYLDKYLVSWQNNEYDTFSSMIHKDFGNNKRQRATSFLKNKKNLMSIFPYKKIEASEVEVYKENGIKNMIVFKQNYCAPNMMISGRKKLHLQKDGDEWKIIGEEFKNLPADFEVKTKITSFIQNWKTSWETKDIDGYIKYYNNKFSSRRMNLNDWKAYKADRFDQTNNIAVNISDIRIHAISPVKYTVVFKQKYKTDSYSDFGYKKLSLVGCPGDFQIVSEGWSAIK